MRAQQTNVDTIANNLANVNTVGYKKETNEFKSLLYQTIQAKTTSANGDTKPVGAQVGLGVKNAAIASIFTQGNVQTTEKDTDFAIEGDGFFSVMGLDGETYYTRNGSFVWTTSENGIMLTNSEGLPVLDIDGNSIEFSTGGEEDYNVSEITIDAVGNICYPDESGNPQVTGMQIGLVQFANPSGLEKQGSTLYKVTDASGEPVSEADGVVSRSTIKQGCLEMSNVQVVDEMVNLIVAQRAYELNSKAITTSDDMMQQANQLKR
jgi:flagellar basal-body rod protein FlgG